MITWQWRTFDELTKTELYDLLALRQDIFVLEQKSFYQDLDYKDQKALHILGIQNHKLAAYSRLFLPGILYPDMISFGRIAVASFVRGQGLGKKLLTEILRYLRQNQITAPIKISAQMYLEEFYQSHGFQTISDPYDDAGIMHVDMLKPSDHG